MQLRCVHHIPGRLRLKGSSLRGDRAKLDAVGQSLLAIEGVTAVIPNVVTGSILIKYAPVILRPEALDEQLRRLGSPSGIPQPDGGAFERIAEIFIRKVLDLSVEALAAAALKGAI